MDEMLKQNGSTWSGLALVELSEGRVLKEAKGNLDYD